MSDESDREEELKKIPFRKIDKSKWPPNVRTIGIGEADALGIDAELYWHGKQVEIKRPLVLSWWQKIGAFLVAASTVSMALTDLGRFYHEQYPHPIAAQSAQQPANLPNAGE